MCVASRRENKWEMQSGYVFRGILTIRTDCIFQLYFLSVFDHWHQYHLHFNVLNDGWRDKNYTAGAICVLYHCQLGELVLNLFFRNVILRFPEAASFWWVKHTDSPVEKGRGVCRRCCGLQAAWHTAVWCFLTCDSDGCTHCLWICPWCNLCSNWLGLFLPSCFLPCALPLKN